MYRIMCNESSPSSSGSTPRSILLWLHPSRVATYSLRNWVTAVHERYKQGLRAAISTCASQVTKVTAIRTTEAKEGLNHCIGSVGSNMNLTLNLW